MRFATRVLLLQLATVAAVVVVSCVVFLLLGIQQLRAEAENSALNIARTIAADPDVRTEVTRISADPGTPAAADLVDGPLQTYATAITSTTGTLFVVIADDHGIRLAHPDPALLGQEVSTDYREVLAGNEVVTWETGTLGVSARAKVPIYPLDASERGANASPVGEVSVGFEPASVFDDLPTLALATGAVAASALAIGLIAALLLRRRFERLTLGLQPEDLVALLQNQSAVLGGVGDGVLALDPDGVVRVCNRTAADLLGVGDVVGRRLAEIGLPTVVVDAVADGTARDGVVVGGRVLYVDSRPVQREGRPIGDVLIVRDRTMLVGLSERLESVRVMTGALRAQRHEFANRMHVAVGLLDADRADDARSFLGEQLARGPVDYPVAHLDLISDAALQSLIGAKAIEAGERGVQLSVAADSLLVPQLDDLEDVAAVLGNLVDNAVSAAVRGAEPREVEIGCYGDDMRLVLTVEDSGPGLDVDDPFAPRDIETGADASTGAGDEDRVHGWGIGLRLSRELARRRGGDVWVIDRGRTAGSARGAVFGARLEGVLRPARRNEDTP